jgi:Tol biopolymer transport system component
MVIFILASLTLKLSFPRMRNFFSSVHSTDRTSVGSSDIYVSYNQNGKWRAPLPVRVVNTPAREYSPRLTPDGKRLIFASERGMRTEQRTKPWTITEFEQKSRSIWNGLGNIYSVPIDVLPKAPKE